MIGRTTRLNKIRVYYEKQKCRSGFYKDMAWPDKFIHFSKETSPANTLTSIKQEYINSTNYLGSYKSTSRTQLNSIQNVFKYPFGMAE